MVLAHQFTETNQFWTAHILFLAVGFLPVSLKALAQLRKGTCSAAEINTALSKGRSRRQRLPNITEVIMAVACYPGNATGCFAEQRQLQGVGR